MNTQYALGGDVLGEEIESANKLKQQNLLDELAAHTSYAFTEVDSNGFIVSAKQNSYNKKGRGR